MNLKNLPKVPFRILSFSSEDTNYPVTELLHQNPQSKGWQTQRFCDFPQELVIELNAPTRVQYMQFLSHQCKISSKVEIFAFMPKEANARAGMEYALNPSDMKFSKIGYFFFNSNEASNFQSRELKTVILVDVSALYLKITLHKCHVNKLNLFNQVGLIAISVFGEPMSQLAGLAKPSAGEQAYQELEYNMQFDEETLKRLRMLEKARDRAEANEDYGEAKKLNDAITDLKRVGVNLQKLEERKAIAVKNKDYDSAMEIDSLRRAKFSDNIPHINAQVGMAGPTFGADNQGGIRDYGAQKPVKQPQRQRFNEHSHDNRDDVRSPYEGEAEQKGNQRRMQNQSEMSRDAFPANRKKEYQDDPSLSQTPGGFGSRANVQGGGVNPDSIVIPTHKNKGGAGKHPFGAIDEDPMGNKIGGGGGGSDKLENAEEITLADQPRAQPLVPHLSEYIVKGMFSKNWSLRDRATAVLEEEIVKGGKSDL